MALVAGGIMPDVERAARSNGLQSYGIARAIFDRGIEPKFEAIGGREFGIRPRFSSLGIDEKRKNRTESDEPW